MTMRQPNRSPRRLPGALSFIAAAALTAGCPADDGGGGDTQGDTEATQLPDGCDDYVPAGDNAQEVLTEALVDVQPGQTVCIGPGTFSLGRQLTITTQDILIKGEGMEQTILDFSGQVSGGNGILIQADRVTLEDFAVVDTPGDAIRSNDVDGGTYRRIKAGWTAAQSLDNGAYALYPVQSSNIHVDGCIAYNARDAGLYIGQSTNVLVENSEAYGNVIGLEIENTTDSVVRNNNVHDNAAGILIITLPGLDLLDGKRANVHDNIVVNNNIPNFGDPGTVVGVLPPGSGVLVVATDSNELWQNEITGNKSVGIGLIGFLEALLGPPNDPEFDIYSQGNYIHDNTLAGNGYEPDQLVLLLNGMASPGPEVVTDGCSDPDLDNAEGALSNCMSIGGASFYNADFCNQAGGSNTDIAPFDCLHDPLPTESPVMLE